MVNVAQLPDRLRRLYPFQPQSFRTPRGALLSYVDEGPRSDEAVLMLHGNPTWSFYYRNLVRALAPKLRCVVPDHVGMGLSEKPQNYPYTLATRIEDVAALVARLGLKRVHLIVHDWGGAIGFGWAVKHPEMVGRIVVLNTAAFLSPHLPARIGICKAPGLGALLVRGCNGFAWPATWMAMHRRKLTAEEKAGYLFPYGSWANRVAVHAFVRDIPMTPAHPSYRTLQEIEQGLGALREKPMRIVWGGADFCFHRKFYERWVNEFPQAEAHYLDTAGHYVLEEITEREQALIKGFYSA